jgi:hypothetical protein
MSQVSDLKLPCVARLLAAPNTEQKSVYSPTIFAGARFLRRLSTSP